MGKTYFYNFPNNSIGDKFYKDNYDKGMMCYKNKQYEDAVFYLRRACVYYDSAKVALGYCYKNGTGVEKNLFKALHLYRMCMSRYQRECKLDEKIDAIVKIIEDNNLKENDNEEYIYDKVLGKIKICWSTYIDHSIVKFCKDYILVTTSYQVADIAIDDIYKALATRDYYRNDDNLMYIDENFKRDYPLFKLRIARNNSNEWSYKNQNEIYTILVPKNADFNLVQVREYIIEYANILMKKQATSYILERLKIISKNVGIEYSKCKILSERGSNYIGRFYPKTKVIEISYHLIKSSPEFIDTILIHELCHTFSNYHDALFYAKMEEVSSKEYVRIDKEDIGHCNVYDI